MRLARCCLPDICTAPTCLSCAACDCSAWAVTVGSSTHSSMSKPGLFRALKEFLSEFRAFGNSELDNLKTQAGALQRQLDQLEAMRAARVKQEEALALMQVESAVQTLQQMDRIKRKQESMVAEAVAKASAQADKRIKAVLEQKAQQVVSNLDLSKALAMDLPPEEVVAGAMQEAQEKLKVDMPEMEQARNQEERSGQQSGQRDINLLRDKG